MSTQFCSSCCASCFVSPPESSSLESPYNLSKLLGIGTLPIPITVESQHRICDHAHADDGWHHFQEHALLSQLSSLEDISMCRELAFLVNQRFISATYASTYDGMMSIRIYLIPYDLGDVHGKLRVRKENVLNPARRYMRNLLPRISQDRPRWYELKPISEDCRLLPMEKDARTLADIYSDLASPQAVPVPGYGNIATRLLNLDDKLEGLGMRSTLHRYQRRSVAAMFQKELDTHDVPDPLYIKLTTMNNHSFYLQPGTMEVLQEQPISAPCRGGILCEELGTGKTLMMLGLILATRNQISTPELSIVDKRPIMTPLSFRHFPSSEFAIARMRLFPSATDRPRGVPSLVELMLHQARTTPNDSVPPNSLYSTSVKKEEKIHTLPLGEILRSNVPFYHHYLGELSNRQRAQRNKHNQTPRVIYLTSATIVVVPANLLSQWDREIIKHCKIPLRVLILRAKTALPTVQSLATDYDIILTSYTRFTAEAGNREISKLHSRPPCTCPEIEGCRVPKCTCQTTEVSPFLQIRWKRLVVDEGHVSSALSSVLVHFAKLLSAERRWIVTGTPTTNLLGLSLGSKSSTQKSGGSETVDAMSMEEDAATENADAEISTGILPFSPASTNSLSSLPSTSSLEAGQPSSTGPTIRIWNRYDREDLNKLGNMITHFIAVPQFTADSKLISTHIVEPLLDPSGPRPGAIQVLNQVMEMVMIRHRIEEVEQDVVLPPVTQEFVLLDLDPYVIKSFNALQAIILINAVDSQRTDQDYMFHPRNTEFLQDTVRNMSQILFWHVDENLYNAKQLVTTAETHIQTAIARKLPQDDIMGLISAFTHLRLALEDPLWRSLQAHEDIPYRVYGLNEHVYNAWTRTPEPEPNCHPKQTGFMHADRLLKLHRMVIQNPLMKEDKMVEWGKVAVHRDLMFRTAFEDSQLKKSKGRRKSKFHDEVASTSRMAGDFAKKASAAETLREMQQELDATMARLQRTEDEDGVPSTAPQVGSPTKRPLMLIASSPLTKMQIGSSASAKLNYIINEVQKYSPKEKFLVFSESALSLAHVAEALELIQVKFLRFTTQVTPQVREQLVLTFETSEIYRVFLMELKHGARGLNLISASRIIFCEPVWQADVESQAIKRAHRIGQTRLITVKTLAIRDTAEENMVARRTVLRNSQEKLPKVIDEAGMRHYIANPRFIIDPPVLTPIDHFPLIRLPPEFSEPRPHSVMLRIPALPTKTSPSVKRIRTVDPITEEVVPVAEVPPSKKKKDLSIRFASP